MAVLESGRSGERTARRNERCRRPRGNRQTRLLLLLCSERGGGGGGLAVAPGMLCEPLEALPEDSRGRHCVDIWGGATGSQRGMSRNSGGRKGLSRIEVVVQCRSQ